MDIFLISIRARRVKRQLQVIYQIFYLCTYVYIHTGTFSEKVEQSANGSYVQYSGCTGISALLLKFILF